MCAIKPQLRDRIAIYNPDIDINAASGSKIASSIKASATTLKSLDIVAILFSLEGVKEMEEIGMKLIISALADLQKLLEVDIGVIDYPVDWFHDIKEFSSNTSIALYKNFEVAYLLLTSKKHHRFDKAVIYDENEMFRQLMTSELNAKGYKVIVANSRDAYEKMAKEGAYGTIYIADTHLDLLHSFIPTHVKNGAIIYELQDEIDKKFVNHFNFSAHQGRIEDGFKLFIFDASSVKKANPKIFNFFVSLSLQSLKHGVKIFIAGLEKRLILESIKENLKKAGVILVDTPESIFLDSRYKELKKQVDKSKGLTKKLVSALPLFIDASLETFESLIGAKAAKKSHKITPYKAIEKSRLVASSLAFEGELHGTLVLVFNENIAKKAALSLLGDDNCSFEELLDVLSEFANIIGGRAKALLAEKETHITIKLPETFDDEQKLLAFLGGKSGVQIDLEINSDPVVMFLTY